MSLLSGFGFSDVPPRRQRTPSRADKRTLSKVEDTPISAHLGRRRKSIEVPCCEQCDSHYLTIKTSRGDNEVWLVCRECEFEWKDERCDMIATPRARRVMGP
jgi:hypothetical protein